MIVKGIKHSTGEYNGNKYDNYILYVINQDDNNTIGLCPEIVKVKSSLISEVINPLNIDSLIDRDINFYYDRYGKVVQISVK